MTDDEVEIFQQKAVQIRQKAEQIYNKFQGLFTVPDGQSFWQYFTNQVDHFKEVTKNMPDETMFGLLSDPTITGML